MNLEELIENINQIKTHRQKEIVTSLKKPLLILYLISLIENGMITKNKFYYHELESELDKLIRTFGGRTSNPQSTQPFHHLNSSEFWELHVPKGVIYNNKVTLNKKILRDPETYGFFSNGSFEILKKKQENRKKVVQFILEKYWPETIQHDLLIYLNFENLNTLKKKRDPNFVKEVLSNYRYKCAICDFTGLLNNTPFGIDAAHIFWHAYGGPDLTQNGIALCKIHHWAFDRGATISADILKVNVSTHFIGQEDNSIYLIDSFDQTLVKNYRSVAPKEEYLEWHNRNVFLR